MHLVDVLHAFSFPVPIKEAIKILGEDVNLLAVIKFLMTRKVID